MSLWVYITLAILINWNLCLVLSWSYVLWLWLVSGDVYLEGWIKWKFPIPTARFRLISTKSWYAKAWSKFYGFALFLAIIHRDQKGQWDDEWVQKTIVHEMRHVKITVWFGLLSWIAYGLHFVFLKLFTSKDPYHDNWFEIDARRAADMWEQNGRPPIYNFGERK